MEIRFEESNAIVGIYHAMLGDRSVGLIVPEGKRWKATVYREGGDWEFTTTQRHTAEAFIKNNVTVPVEG